MHLNSPAPIPPLLWDELIENAAFDPDTARLLEAYQQAGGQVPASERLRSELYVEAATLRNRNLITRQQQGALRQTVVAFFGMSVGSHAVLAWMMEARADAVLIADPDRIMPSNLNRLRLGWREVGALKVDAVKQEILALHPSAEVRTLTETDHDHVARFLKTDPRVAVIVDEVDDLAAKALLRQQARALRIPLLSATDVGDNVLLDVERYDLTPQPDAFLGRLTGVDLANTDFSTLSRPERVRLSLQIVGLEACSEAMLDSLLAIGSRLKTWPQLGATATIGGALVATAIKKIVLGEPVQSGRYSLSLDCLLTRSAHDTTLSVGWLEKADALKRRYGL